MPDSYFSNSRNIELSVIYFLETSVNTDWTNISTVKSFTNAYKASLPVIAIYLSDINTSRREIGSTTLLQDFVIDIDIFAKSDGQRIDLADYITDKLKDSFTYYSHSQTSGDPDTLTRVADGSIFVTNYITSTKIEFGESANRYDQHRHFIQVSVRKSQT